MLNYFEVLKKSDNILNKLLHFQETARCKRIAENEMKFAIERADKTDDPIEREKYLYGSYVAKWILKAIERGDDK